MNKLPEQLWMLSQSNIETRVRYEKSNGFLGPKRVLVVEDEPYWQLLVCETLKISNESVVFRSVKSVKDAERVLKEESSGFDLIVSDHNLKNQSTGLALWRNFQKLGIETNFVILSGLDRDTYASRFLLKGEEPLYFEKNAISDLVEILDRKMAFSAGSNLVNSNFKYKERDVIELILGFIAIVAIWQTGINMISSYARATESKTYQPVIIQKTIEQGLASSEALSKLGVSKFLTRETKEIVKRIIARDNSRAKIIVNPGQ
ncbi:MAG: hypothetical protein B7Y39_07770 [Bdellovibrio sp. 28-41-41]|nr:MAG: hypothetical protein B7Y39_07770 [Bdellovibrio sp. 28-41-41]